MDAWRQDLRQALRQLGGSPTFTAAAVLSLAIALGANTAVFSVANAIILRPLPYPEPDRLAILWQRSPGLNVQQDWLSTGQYLDIALENTVFERTAAAIGASFNMTGDGPPERVDGVRVSSSFFPLFGAQPGLGRVFSADDDTPGGERAVVLTHGFWVRRFGSDPAIIGRRIVLNDLPFTIVGVTSRAFIFGKEVMPAVNGIQRTDLILPLPLAASARANRNGEDFNVFARLKPGVTVAHAQSEMDAIAARMRLQYPAMYPETGGLTISIVPLLDQVVGDLRMTLYVLLGAVALVLLIACGNVANLLLARATVRERELAIRAAVGARRGRLVRQLVTESLVLSLAGALVGLAIGLLGIATLRFFEPADVPRAADIRLDGPVLAFTGVVSLVTPLLFGLGPALRGARTDPNTVLRGGGRGASDHPGGRHTDGRRLLIVTEVALSVIVLLGAGLLIRSYQRITRANPGFDPGNVLSFRLTLPAARYNTPESVSLFFDRLEHDVRGLPGVVSIGTNYQLPLSSVALAWEPISIEGYVPRAPSEERIISSSAYISADYLRTMGIPLLQGRAFTDTDNRSAPPVAIVDDHLAARFWPHDSPLGKRLRQGSDGPWRTVVGVVDNAREYELSAQPPITVYFPVEQYRIASRFVVVRTRPGLDHRAALSAVLRQVAQLDPDLPAYDVSTMEQRLQDSLARRRLSMLVLATFAAFALILSAVGVYGVIAYWVNQRRREIGIRMALGADDARILRLLGREVVAIVGVGVVAGLLGALALTRIMRDLLFGVTPTDLPTYLLVSLIILVTSVVATYVPARRATRVHPGSALREA